MIWNVLYDMADAYHVLEQHAVSFLGQNMGAAGSFKTQVYNYQTTFHNTAVVIYTALTASCLIIIACVIVIYTVYS